MLPNKTALLVSAFLTTLSPTLLAANASATTKSEAASTTKTEANATTTGEAPKKDKLAGRSPWLFMPLFSASPKLDTAVGAMGSYIHRFDPESRASMFGMSAKYTTSDSLTMNAYARTSFGKDHHRLVAAFFGGDINNDYENYLNSGKPLETQDSFRSFFTRYLYRIEGDWFLGAQAAYSNYELSGSNAVAEEWLEEAQMAGFKSGAIGAVVLHDSRSNEFSPVGGWYLNANSMSYLEKLGGEQDFDVFRVDFRYYWGHGDGNVIALRQRNQFSHEAPESAYSPIYLRGYTPGEYLAQHMSAIEIEERYKLAERWTATVFAGVACLYGEDTNGKELSCNDSDNAYPAWGGGIQYIIKPEEGMVANLEYAMGKDNNSGIYLKMGYSF